MIHLYGGGHDYIQRVVKPEGGGGEGARLYTKKGWSSDTLMGRGGGGTIIYKG